MYWAKALVHVTLVTAPMCAAISDLQTLPETPPQGRYKSVLVVTGRQYVEYLTLNDISISTPILPGSRDALQRRRREPLRLHPDVR